MIASLLLTASLCLSMVLPYLPGRVDASASTFSLIAQVAAFGSLLFAPIGVAWIVNRKRSVLWRRSALAVGVLISGAMAVAALSMNQFSIGVLLGAGAIVILYRMYRRTRSGYAQHQGPAPYLLVCVPVMLLVFRASVLPAAASWSRDRAIRSSAPLITAIESFRQRRGHYPLSLQSLNPDVPAGVAGIERFHYEPQGEAYNLFFIRPHIDLDAREVVLFNPRDEHRFTSHELDLLEYDGDHLDLRRGDRRRTQLAHPHWISILFD